MATRSDRPTTNHGEGDRDHEAGDHHARLRNLIRWLFDNHLVDEIILLTYPVVIGQGRRLFPDTGTDAALELVDSRSTVQGVTIGVYRLSGRPQYGTATPD